MVVETVLRSVQVRSIKSKKINPILSTLKIVLNAWPVSTSVQRNRSNLERIDIPPPPFKLTLKNHLKKKIGFPMMRSEGRILSIWLRHFV
jgi:hypothetical protein